jgi:ferrous iron transport protein A
MKKHQSGRIISIRAAGSLTGRLMAMGLLPGATVQVLGVAPLGDPMLVQLEGCRMSLRRSEAESLTIEEQATSLGA